MNKNLENKGLVRLISTEIEATNEQDIVLAGAELVHGLLVKYSKTSFNVKVSKVPLSKGKDCYFYANVTATKNLGTKDAIVQSYIVVVKIKHPSLAMEKEKSV